MLLTEFDEKDYIEGVREEGERKGREEGERKGREEGRNKMIYSLVEDKSISMEKGAEKLGISVEKLKADMINAGYKCLQGKRVNMVGFLMCYECPIR